MASEGRSITACCKRVLKQHSGIDNTAFFKTLNLGILVRKSKRHLIFNRFLRFYSILNQKADIFCRYTVQGRKWKPVQHSKALFLFYFGSTERNHDSTMMKVKVTEKISVPLENITMNLKSIFSTLLIGTSVKIVGSIRMAIQGVPKKWTKSKQN